MSSAKRTRHFQNVANLGVMISHCKGYGSNYQPFNPKITIRKLEAVYADSLTSVENVNLFEDPYNKAVRIRIVAFKPLKKLTTRILQSLTLCGASQEAIDNASILARKVKCIMECKRDKTNLNDLQQESESISLLQMGFDNRLNNFYRLIQALKIEPKYNPGEAYLEVTALEARHADLTIKNDAVREAGEPLIPALLERNRLLYAEGTGLVYLAADVKKYVSSVYGADSLKFKRVGSIFFRQYGGLQLEQILKKIQFVVFDP